MFFSSCVTVFQLVFFLFSCSSCLSFVAILHVVLFFCSCSSCFILLRQPFFMLFSYSVSVLRVWSYSLVVLYAVSFFSSCFLCWYLSLRSRYWKAKRIFNRWQFFLKFSSSKLNQKEIFKDSLVLLGLTKKLYANQL